MRMRSLLVLPVLLGTGLFATPARAQAAVLPCATAAGHVSLIVEHGDGSTVERCVGVPGSSTTGKSVLDASGVEWQSSGYGGALGDAVCQVDNEPTSYQPQCLQPNDPYWVIFYAHAGGRWIVSAKGVSALQLSSGDSLGLRYEKTSYTPGPSPSYCPVQPSPSAAATHHSAVTAAPHTGTATAAAPRVMVRDSHPATASPSPTGGVEAMHTAVGARPPGKQPPSGVSVAALLAFLCAGGLIGMLGLQLSRR